MTVQFASAHESVVGTKRTSGDVCCLVAIGGKADMALTAHFGSELTLNGRI
jgi:hypothetical protein